MKIRAALATAVAACIALVVSGTAAAQVPPVALLVTGGMTQAPFTTPDRACRLGKPAGTTFTALRSALLAVGIDAYTAPGMSGPGVAKGTAILPSFQCRKCPRRPQP